MAGPPRQTKLAASTTNWLHRSPPGNFLRSIKLIMKIFRAIAAVAFLAAISATSIFAQPKPAGSPVGAGSAPVQTAALPDAKIALVDTEQFLDEKTGISRLVAAAKRVENEFQPRRTEMQTLNSQ